MDSHEIQCEKEYWSDLCADVGTLPSVQDRDETTQFGLFPIQSWRKETKCSRFEEPVVGLTNNRDSAKMLGDVDHEHKSL